MDIILQLGNYSVGMSCARDNGMTVVAEHMSVNGVDLGNYNIKRFLRLLDYKFNAAYFCPSLLDDISDIVNRAVKALSKSIRKIIYQRFAAPF